MINWIRFKLIKQFIRKTPNTNYRNEKQFINAQTTIYNDLDKEFLAPRRTEKIQFLLLGANFYFYMRTSLKKFCATNRFKNSGPLLYLFPPCFDSIIFLSLFRQSVGFLFLSLSECWFITASQLSSYSIVMSVV